MRPTFLGFETAKRGINVSQKALDITGNNMTNMNTPGYTRQRVDVVSIAPSSYRTRFAASRTDIAGQGANVNGVSQTRDSFLDKRFRDEYGDFGYYDQYASIMSDIEMALDEVETDTGLKNGIAELVKSLNNFSANADSETHANIVATNFKNIVQVLNSFNNKLQNAAEQQKYNLEVSVDSVNTTLEKIASLNKAIAEDIGATGYPRNEYYGSNELLDQRNLLLDELAQYGDTEVTQQHDGTVTVKMNGHLAVEGKTSQSMRYSKNNDGTVGIFWSDSGKPVELTTGGLKASVDLINGRGPGVRNSNESLEKGFLYFHDQINTFANTLVQTMNNIIPKLDADGNPMMNDGKPVYKELLAAKIQQADGTILITGDALVTASNITISEELAKSSNYLIYKKGDRKSDYPLMMANALNKNSISFRTQGGTFNGTFEDFVNNYVGEYGSASAFNQDRMTASSAIADDLLNRRDQISGVSRDEEGTNMMMYQKSFQAAARLMTTLDEALDVLINRTGMVGR